MSSEMISLSLVLLGAGIFGVLLFHRLGLGSVLTYLVAGVLIGPSALGIVSHVESILHVSELSIVFFLFIVGLELAPSKLWALRRRIFGLGGLQVLLSSGVLMLAIMPFLAISEQTTSEWDPIHFAKVIALWESLSLGKSSIAHCFAGWRELICAKSLRLFPYFSLLAFLV